MEVFLPVSRFYVVTPFVWDWLYCRYIQNFKTQTRRQIMVYKEIEWKNYKGVLLPLTAQHQSVNLSKKEQNLLLKKSGVHLIRWVNEWDNSLTTNYWYVIKDSFGGLAELKSNMRNQVRKGLKLCEVRKIDADFLLKNGYVIYKKAHIHYQQKSNSPIKIPTGESFKNIYKKIATISEFWGVFEMESNQFIAFAENVIRDRGVVYGSMKFDPAYLKLYPSYALIHTMNQYYLEDCKMRYVSDGHVRYHTKPKSRICSFVNLISEKPIVN